MAVQRANIKRGLPANHAAVPSYKTDIAPAYKRDPTAAYEPPIPTTAPAVAPPPVQEIPKPPGGRIGVILHLYSGQRRHEDFQHWHEVFTSPDDTSTHVLSIDIANNSKTGDLTNWTTIAFWLNQMALGRVAAILAGPPW